MVSMGDMADVTLAIQDTDEDEEDEKEEEDEQDEGGRMEAGLLWRQCANLQPLLEEGKRNGARRISG